MGSKNDSLTPLRPTRADWQKSFTPKNAMNSLRQHIQTSGKDKGKRGALADITGGRTEEMNGPSGPEVFASVGPDADVAAGRGQRSPTKQHGKSASVAKSMIGSLRSLSRRGNSMSKPNSPDSDYDSPSRQAMTLPLPSSPVNSPAPTLMLNLGDTANMSTSFLQHEPEFDQRKELLALTDPTNDAAMRIPTYYTRLPGQGPTDALLSADRNDMEPFPDLLPVDKCFGERYKASAPDSSAQMNFDGINDIFEEPPLFERSVEARDSPEKQTNKSLKKMISIDALAEQHVRESPLRGMHLVPASGRKVRDCSATTARDCPQDMRPLSRQQAASPVLSVDHQSTTPDASKAEDPFAAQNATGDTAVLSPVVKGHDMALPYRPKIKEQTTALDNESEIRALFPQETTVTTLTADDGSPLLEVTSGETVLLGKLEAQRIAARAVGVHAVQGSVQDSVAEVPSVAETMRLWKQNSGGISTQCSSRLSSAQYDQFHPEHFLGLEECIAPNPPSETPEHETRTSENSQPGATTLSRRVPPSQTPSPPVCIPSPPRMQTGIGQHNWRFSVQDWMQKGVGATAPSLEPSPYRRGSDTASLDSISLADQRLTPPVSPTTTTPKRSPAPSMGDRLSFELKRSNRNMRYNALSETSNATPTQYNDTASMPVEVIPTPVRCQPMLHGADLDHRPDRDSSFPNFETAFSNSTRSSPKQKVTPRRYRADDPSSDSIESELEEAITDHYKFQDAFDVVDPPLLSADIGGVAPDAEQIGLVCKNSFEVLAGLDDESEPHEHDDAKSIKLGTSPIAREHESVVDDRDPSGLPVEHLYNTPASGVSPADSLDDCLDLYKSYEACQGQFPEDNPSSDGPSPSITASSPPIARHQKSQSALSRSPASPHRSKPAEKVAGARRSINRKKSKLGNTSMYG